MSDDVETLKAENARLRHFAKLALERVLWGDNHAAVKRAVYEHFGTTDTQELIAAETAMANGFVLFGRAEDIEAVRRWLAPSESNGPANEGSNG